MEPELESYTIILIFPQPATTLDSNEIKLIQIQYKVNNKYLLPSYNAFPFSQLTCPGVINYFSLFPLSFYLFKLFSFLSLFFSSLFFSFFLFSFLFPFTLSKAYAT